MKTKLGKSRFGRGMFANEFIKKRDLIEECQVILFDQKDRKEVDKTKFYDYYFSWLDDFLSGAIALGNGSLYNHSFTPNAYYEKDIKNSLLRFVAYKDIGVNEEILVNYNGDPEDKNKIWFDAL